jgi:hypothetical protein
MVRPGIAFMKNVGTSDVSQGSRGEQQEKDDDPPHAV